MIQALDCLYCGKDMRGIIGVCGCWGSKLKVTYTSHGRSEYFDDFECLYKLINDVRNIGIFTVAANGIILLLITVHILQSHG